MDEAASVPEWRKPTYRLYIDEVGNSDLDSSDDENHRFLSLTGVILKIDYVGAIVHPEMEELKKAFFGSHPDEPVIFHRKEMLNAKTPFEALRDEATRNRFDEALLDLLRRWEFTAITVCIDKRAHKERYARWRFDPYHYCLAVLIERFAYFLNRRGSCGDVLAESRGGKEDRRLKDSFQRLWEHGTDFLAPADIQRAITSKQLKIKPKANNIAGLQVADLIAHPSRNEILLEQNLLGRELAPFAARVVEILQAKYDRFQERVRGAGKKFI